jgi:hypothetical protein
MRVASVKYIKDYILEVTLQNGTVKTYNFKKWLFSDINPMLFKYRKLNLFKQVRAKNGALIWGDDEMDLTPDHMVEMENNSRTMLKK